MEATQQSSLAKKIIKGTLVVLFFWMFWKFGGLLLSVIIGNLYPPGKAPAADAYAAVYKHIVFTFVYSSALKVLIPAFMPIFIEKMKQDGETKAWEFAYSVINIALMATIALSAIGMIFTQQIVWLLVPGFSAETKVLSTTLLQIMLPGCIGMVLSMLMMSVLHSYKVFAYPAAGDAAQKLVWAAALFLGVKLLHFDVRTVAYGFLAGCVVQVVINGFGLRAKRGLYRPVISDPRFPRFLNELVILAAFGGAFFLAARFSARIVSWAAILAAPGASGEDVELWTRFFIFTSGLAIACAYSTLLWARARKKSSTCAHFAALIAPLIIGVVFARYRNVVTSMFQSFTKAGVFADIEFGKNIGNLPTVLVAYGLSIAMFPYLCELASGKDMKAFATLVTRALRMIALFFIPLSITMVLLAKPIIALVYDRGNWLTSHVGYSATAMSVFVCALFFYAIENVVMLSYFSVQRMWMPTFLGIVAALMQVAFLFIGIQVLGYNHPYDIFLAVIIAYPLSRLFKNTALLAILRLRVPILPLRETAVFLAKLIVVCAAYGCVVYGVRRAIEAAIPMEKFKQTDVVLDTFNAENANWSSRDADDLQIEHTDDHGTVLAISYRPMPNRDVVIERELNQFRLEDVSLVSFTCRASEPQDVIVEISFGERTWRSEPIPIAAQWRGEPYTVSVPAGMGRAERMALVLPKLNHESDGGFLRRRPKTPRKTLLVKEVRVDSGGREIIVDSFSQPSPAWRTPEGVLLVSDIGEDVEEQALLLADVGKSTPASRDLAGYDLRNTSGVKFKIKAGSPGKLRVRFADAAGNTLEKTLAIAAGDTRKACAVAFEEFTGAADISLLERVSFDFTADPGAAPGRVWLDNVTFTMRRLVILGFCIKYELVKLLHVAAPCLLGGIVLIGLIFVLRIEEGRLVFDWAKEQGREKLAKFTGRARTQS